VMRMQMEAELGPVDLEAKRRNKIAEAKTIASAREKGDRRKREAEARRKELDKEKKRELDRQRREHYEEEEKRQKKFKSGGLFSSGSKGKKTRREASAFGEQCAEDSVKANASPVRAELAQKLGGLSKDLRKRMKACDKDLEDEAELEERVQARRKEVEEWRHLAKEEEKQAERDAVGRALQKNTTCVVQVVERGCDKNSVEGMQSKLVKMHLQVPTSEGNQALSRAVCAYMAQILERSEGSLTWDPDPVVPTVGALHAAGVSSSAALKKVTFAWGMGDVFHF